MMKSLVPLLIVLSLALTGVRAVAAKEAPAAKSALQVTLAKDPAAKTPATTFGASEAAIYVTYQDADLKKGDKVTATWYIEDGGKTITKNVKVSESVQTEERAGAPGYLNLNKPAAGFPPGKWRVEVAVNGAKVGSYKFMVTK